MGKEKAIVEGASAMIFKRKYWHQMKGDKVGRRLASPMSSPDRADYGFSSPLPPAKLGPIGQSFITANRVDFRHREHARATATNRDIGVSRSLLDRRYPHESRASFPGGGKCLGDGPGHGIPGTE
jgi:hypothetical protein